MTRVKLQSKYTLSDVGQAHPAPSKLAACLHVTEVLLIRNLHIQGPVEGTFCCSLCVWTEQLLYYHTKKGEKGYKGNSE